jgi:hypothetical protein
MIRSKTNYIYTIQNMALDLHYNVLKSQKWTTEEISPFVLYFTGNMLQLLLHNLFITFALFLEYPILFIKYLICTSQNVLPEQTFMWFS